MCLFWLVYLCQGGAYLAMRIATVHFGPHVRARACDFNRHALPLLWWFARHLLTVVLRHFDILEDNDIRQGLKLSLIHI